MELTNEGVEKQIEESLFGEDPLPCVCSKVSEKNSFSGWRPNGERKGTKKRYEASRSESHNYASLRRERTIAAPTDGFVFRHYESTGSYIQQYRENHCSAAMVGEFEGKPVKLGVDMPDPYLPKITTSSLIERMRIIEALSDYYRLTTTISSEMRNVCLTGKRAEPAHRRALPNTPVKSTTERLPLISTQGNVTQETETLSTVCENDERDSHELNDARNDAPTSEQEKPIQLVNIYNDKNITPHGDREKLRLIKTDNSKSNEKLKSLGTPKSITKKSSRLPTPQIIYRSEKPPAKEQGVYKPEKPQVREQTKLPKVPQWTMVGSNERKKILETLRIGRKLNSSGKDCNYEESDASCRNLVSSGGVPLPSEGNLCIGKTLISPRSKNTANQAKVGKCEFFSSTSPLKILHNGTNNKPKFSSMNTAFIEILGQATGPPPKPSLKPEKKTKTRTGRAMPDNSPSGYRIPLQYVRDRLGSHLFHHVLEARSFQRETRDLGTTVNSELK